MYTDSFETSFDMFLDDSWTYVPYLALFLNLSPAPAPAPALIFRVIDPGILVAIRFLFCDRKDIS